MKNAIASAAEEAPEEEEANNSATQSSSEAGSGEEGSVEIFCTLCRSLIGMKMLIVFPSGFCLSFYLCIFGT